MLAIARLLALNSTGRVTSWKITTAKYTHAPISTSTSSRGPGRIIKSRSGSAETQLCRKIYHWNDCVPYPHRSIFYLSAHMPAFVRGDGNGSDRMLPHKRLPKGSPCYCADRSDRSYPRDRPPAHTVDAVLPQHGLCELTARHAAFRRNLRILLICVADTCLRPDRNNKCRNQNKAMSSQTTMEKHLFSPSFLFYYNNMIITRIYESFINFGRLRETLRCAQSTGTATGPYGSTYPHPYQLPRIRRNTPLYIDCWRRPSPRRPLKANKVGCPPLSGCLEYEYSRTRPSLAQPGKSIMAGCILLPKRAPEWRAAPRSAMLCPAHRPGGQYRPPPQNDRSMFPQLMTSALSPNIYLPDLSSNSA